MREKVRFPNRVYVILLLVLVIGLLLQFSRSQYLLQFQQNHDLLAQRDRLLAEAGAKPKVEKAGNDYCVATSLLNEYSEKLKKNAFQTLDYMKKKTREIHLEDAELMTENCAVIIFATDSLEQVNNIKEIVNFVSNGGYVLFMSALENEKNYQVIYRMLGVLEFGDQIETSGIHLKSNVLIGEGGLSVKEDFIVNTAVPVGLDDEVDVLVESTEKIPLLWKQPYQEGAFMVFNGTMLEEKMNRGFFAGSLSLLEPNYIYPIFNSKVFYIDDFPSPIPEGTNPVIFAEYKKDIPSFYQEVWWPNMLKTAKRYDIKYTGAIIQSYNDQTEPPYLDPIDEAHHQLITYGREVIKSGGELGIHGYNHQSFVTDKKIAASFGYNAWNNEEDMAESIQEILDYINEAFPQYRMMSYVPPSNVLSEEGREALKKAWPDLTVIASLYGEDATDVSYVQEYEVADDGIIEMPRITSGYSERVYDRWAEANTMTGLGIYSHFVHPDDVISMDRNDNMTWEQMYKEFNENMSRLKKTYPWARAMTSTESALNLASVLAMDVEWTNLPNRIEGRISNYQTDTEAHYVLRTDRKIGHLSNCTVEKIDVDTYLVVASGAEFKIGLGES